MNNSFRSWEVQDQGAGISCVSSEVPILFIDSYLLAVSSQDRSSQGAFWCLCYIRLIPFMRPLPSWPNHCPKAPPPNTITLEMKFSAWEFWRGWKHSIYSNDFLIDAFVNRPFITRFVFQYTILQTACKTWLRRPSRFYVFICNSLPFKSCENLLTSLIFGILIGIFLSAYICVARALWPYTPSFSFFGISSWRYTILSWGRKMRNSACKVCPRFFISHKSWVESREDMLCSAFCSIGNGCSPWVGKV